MSPGDENVLLCVFAARGGGGFNGAEVKRGEPTNTYSQTTFKMFKLKCAILLNLQFTILPASFFGGKILEDRFAPCN